MALDIDQKEPEVIVQRYDSMVAIILNRPRAINALTVEMIRLMRQALDEALAQNRFQFVLLSGAGSRGFCAGGDIKRLAKAVREKALGCAELFFHEEYALDLYLHRFPKPVIVIADGITMGGGLGLSAGADLVVATESSVMAMPETRIGFSPMSVLPAGCSPSAPGDTLSFWDSQAMKQQGLNASASDWQMA